jgi:hypothetical protein
MARMTLITVDLIVCSGSPFAELMQIAYQKQNKTYRDIVALPRAAFQARPERNNPDSEPV